MELHSRPTESMTAPAMQHTAHQKHLFQRNANQVQYAPRVVERNLSTSKKPKSLAELLQKPQGGKSFSTLKELVNRDSRTVKSADETSSFSNIAKQQRHSEKNYQPHVSFFDDEKDRAKPVKETQVSSIDSSRLQNNARRATVKNLGTSSSPVIRLVPRPQPHWASNHFKSTYQDLGQSPTAFAKRATNKSLVLGTTAINYEEKSLPSPTSADIGQAPDAFEQLAPNASLHLGTNAITYEF